MLAESTLTFKKGDIKRKCPCLQKWLTFFFFNSDLSFKEATKYTFSFKEDALGESNLSFKKGAIKRECPFLPKGLASLVNTNLSFKEATKCILKILGESTLSIKKGAIVSLIILNINS
jgi:hypothetical protein